MNRLPRSAAAQTIDREREELVLQLLRLKGYRDPRIVPGTVRALNQDVLEVAFTVPCDPPAADGRRAAKTAEICRAARRVIYVADGMPASLNDVKTA